MAPAAVGRAGQLVAVAGNPAVAVALGLLHGDNLHALHVSGDGLGGAAAAHSQRVSEAWRGGEGGGAARAPQVGLCDKEPSLLLMRYLTREEREREDRFLARESAGRGCQRQPLPRVFVARHRHRVRVRVCVCVFISYLRA